MKHKMSDSKEYAAWARLKDVCYNENSRSYKKYGGNGVRMCKEWFDDFRNFFQDMKEIPKHCNGIVLKEDRLKEFNALTAEWAFKKSGNKPNPSIKKRTRVKRVLKEAVSVGLCIELDHLKHLRRLSRSMSLNSEKIVSVNDLIRKAISTTFPLPTQVDMFGGQL